MSSTERKPYPSDLTDAQWELIEPLIPPPLPGGRPRSLVMREVINAILYQTRSGCQWSMLPHDLPCKSSVYEYFAQWRDDGTWQHMLEVLVGAARLLEAPSGEIDPSAASVDSQSVKTTEHAAERGYDGGKKITGRKRHIAVDTLGLVLAIVVTVASVDDAQAARAVFTQLKSDRQPRLKIVWADAKFHNHALSRWLARQRSIRWKLEIVRRPTHAQGFVLLARRWVAERTFSWLNRWRRLTRDYEHLTASSEARVRIATIGRILRRLAPDPTQPSFKYRLTSLRLLG